MLQSTRPASLPAAVVNNVTEDSTPLTEPPFKKRTPNGLAPADTVKVGNLPF
jgi:hypothetical protein